LTYLAGLLGALLTGGLQAQAAPTPREPALARELIRRFAIDQQGRDSIAIALNAGDTAFVMRLMARDSASTRWLQGVVARVGWPGRTLVGDSASTTAFLILQHSPDNAWQAEMLPTLWRLADSGEMKKSDVAMLEDRVRMHQGLPQRYGMSFSLKEGCLVADSIDAPEGLAERRRAVGLPPMDEYMRLLAEAYQVKVVLRGGC